jgi:acyl-CoA synthetase (AMP-forming)/AMP-acid ligase II
MTERVIIMAETSLKKTEESAAFDRLRLAVKVKLQQAGYDVDQVMLLPKGALPRTTSGKIRRHRCRELYLAGSRPDGWGEA